jgi:transcriptional regulator with XRE-family HTH domain
MRSIFTENFLRITAGQNVASIAEKTGLDHGSISRYLSDKREPGIRRLRHLAVVYGVSTDEFFKPLEDAA